MRRLAELAHRRAWWILAATAVLATLAGALGSSVVSQLQSSAAAQFRDPDGESTRAEAALERAGGFDPDPGILALAPAARVREVARRIGADPAIARVRVDGPLVVAYFTPSDSEARRLASERLIEAFAAEPEVRLGGGAVAGTQISNRIQDDLLRAELIAFPLLALLSFWVFRGLVAAALPVLVGAATVGGTLLGLRVAAGVTELSVFALNLVTGLSLGLAIDYSLFVVSRYREELGGGAPPREALERTLLTAGRTVLFSALTVAAALASLLVFEQSFLFSMAIGGVLVALTAAAVSLVTLPAALAVLGPRVNAGAPQRWQRGADRGSWARLAHAVMRRPGAIAAGSAAVLVALGLPFLDVEFTGVDARVLPEEASARQVADALEREGATGRFSPLHVVLQDEPAPALRRELAALPGAAAVLPAVRTGELWRVDVLPRERSLAASSQRLVGLVREAVPPGTLVGGSPATYRDQQTSLAERLPYALALLATTTLGLLFLFTGSVLLPVKALLMNVLTLAAAFGVLVTVFIWLGGETGLESTQPVLLFALAFGLSTDYGVFLLSRIKEAHEAGLSSRDAVAAGLERTGRIVTAAALLFCVAIGSFGTSEIVFIRELALGAAVAVALDATIVRALLVPSLMALLGDWNWWAPAPLRRLHARLGLEG